MKQQRLQAGKRLKFDAKRDDQRIQQCQNVQNRVVAITPVME
ncbi:MAG: hypothetical protein AB8B64_09325 [Granulosicoccus sp.]